MYVSQDLWSRCCKLVWGPAVREVDDKVEVSSLVWVPLSLPS